MCHTGHGERRFSGAKTRVRVWEKQRSRSAMCDFSATEVAFALVIQDADIFHITLAAAMIDREERDKPWTGKAITTQCTS